MSGLPCIANLGIVDVCFTLGDFAFEGVFDDCLFACVVEIDGIAIAFSADVGAKATCVLI